MPLKGTLESRIAYRIKRRKSPVFMREDFADIGGYNQVGRILKQLVEKEALMKLGYGVYVRTKKSIINGKLVPEEPVQYLVTETLERFGIKTVPTNAERAYNEGRSTQVPVGRVMGIQGRQTSRKLGLKGWNIVFEYHI